MSINIKYSVTDIEARLRIKPHNLLSNKNFASGQAILDASIGVLRPTSHARSAGGRKIWGNAT